MTLTSTLHGEFLVEITSHAVCIPDIDEPLLLSDGLIHLGRMTYTKKRRTTVRHVTETQKPFESVRHTHIGGVQDEMLKKGHLFFKPLTPEPIHIEFVPDQDHPGGTHMKVVWPVYVPAHDLRDYEQQDLDNPDELHSAIALVEALELAKEMDGKTIPFQFHGTLAAIRWGRAVSKSAKQRYSHLSSLIEEKLGKFRLTREQELAIAHYEYSW